MKGADNRPPGMVAAKARYMGRDLRRLAAFYHIPLQPPSDPGEILFVKGSLSAMQLLMATKATSHQHLEMLSRQLWKRIWSMDKDIVSEESLREACEAADIERELTDNLIGQIEEASVKDELKRSTQEALDLGAFGAPFIVLHVSDKKEVFFGSDRFELIAHTLAHHSPSPSSPSHSSSQSSGSLWESGGWRLPPGSSSPLHTSTPRRTSSTAICNVSMERT